MNVVPQDMPRIGAGRVAGDRINSVGATLTTERDTRALEVGRNVRPHRNRVVQHGLRGRSQLLLRMIDQAQVVDTCALTGVGAGFHERGDRNRRQQGDDGDTDFRPTRLKSNARANQNNSPR